MIFNFRFHQKTTYTPTPGIDIGNYEVAHVGPLCIWDTAGQIEFHVTHSMFLGSENAMAVISYDLRGGYEDVDVSSKVIKRVLFECLILTGLSV